MSRTGNRIKKINPNGEIKIDFDITKLVAIKGYEGLYSVSKCGTVVSHPKRGSSPFGMIIKQEISKFGYARCTLLLRGAPKKYAVHRLVAQAFIPNPENKPQVNHINGIKTDNRVENLEWCSASDNIYHAFKKGLRKPTNGEINGMAKLTSEDVISIRDQYSNGSISQQKIADSYGVNQSCIQRIVSKKRWVSI